METLDALILAVKRQHLSIIDAILGQRVDVDGSDGRGRTPLMVVLSRAAQSGETTFDETGFAMTAVNLLLANGANPNTLDNDGASTMDLAISLYSVKLVESLLTNGANPNFVNADGETALHRVHSSAPELAKLLFDYGADPQIRDKRGRISAWAKYSISSTQ